MNNFLETHKFSLLKETDIECRVGTQSGTKGVTLLLYKDARVDMSILDAEVGPAFWQRDHKEIKGNMYCGVAIKIDGEWVWKWDCGTESNTEKEKGESSDSFKRACVNWGIGRELYTAPFIWINTDESEYESRNGKQILKTKFSVSHIKYDGNGNITELTIIDNKGKERFIQRDKKAARVSTVQQETTESGQLDSEKPQKPEGLKKGQLITKQMVDEGACKGLIAKLRAEFGTPEYKQKCLQVQGYYKWESIEVYNAVCAAAAKS